MEIWSEISDYPNYEVSILGNIRNKKTKYILKSKEKNGYYRVTLMKNKQKCDVSIHRIVAKTFIKNEDKTKNTVNHIDGDKLNNNLNNLEWVSQKENIKHAIDNNLINTRKCPVIQYDLNKNQIEIFDSIKEITEKYGFDRSFIIRACKNQVSSAYGYKWEYVDKQEIITDFDGKIINNYTNYLVNNNGNIYSKKSKKILKPIKNKNGHVYVSLIHDVTQKKSNFYIHRLVAEYYLDNPNNFSIVIHKNRDKSDNRLENLEWVRYMNQFSAS
jgi:hypothetical protein